MLGFVKGRLVNHVVRNVKKMVPPFDLPAAVRFSDALAKGRSMALTEPKIGPDDIAVLQYTGGTTGVSKGAVLLHRNLVANVLQSEAWYQPALKKTPPGEQIVTVCALPLYHIFGFTTNMMLAMRMGGCNLLIPNARDFAALLKDLSREKFHSFPAVSTLFNALANHPDFDKVDWSHLKISVGGGMAVQQATARLWLEKTGCPICEGYGLSETSPSATCNPVDSTAYSGNIGLPMPGTELKLLDDDGREVPPGTPGEIAIKGPQVMAGYWQRPDETAKVMTADGCFRTGDIGIVDERGYFRIVDRKKDMILVSGFNVYPNEVEDVITQLPGCARVRRGRCARRQGRRGGEGGHREEGPCAHRGRRARLLRSQPHRLQAAEDHRVPRRPAQDAGGQDPAPRAARLKPPPSAVHLRHTAAAMTIRLHVETPLQAGTTLSLPPGAARHAQVRRVQPGEPLCLFDGRGGDWPAEVLSDGPQRGDGARRRARGRGQRTALRGDAGAGHAGQRAHGRAGGEGHRAGRGGAAAAAVRTLGAAPGRRACRTQARCTGRRVAVAACEQSGRARVPVVAAGAQPGAAGWLRRTSSGQRLLLSPQPGARPLREITPGAALCALSGPEGGLAPAEEAAALAAGFAAVGLGPRVLRADTAPLALLAWLGLRELMRHDEYLRLDATAMAAAVARGDVSAPELLQLARDQLARVQPRLNALLRPLDELAEAQLARPPTGTLGGVPFLVKDSVLDVAGVPTSYGSRAMRAIVPTTHAAPLRRLLAAGAVVFGKTNLPEFGLKGVSDSREFGRVSNPWNVDRSAGRLQRRLGRGRGGRRRAHGWRQRRRRLAAHPGGVLRPVRR